MKKAILLALGLLIGVVLFAQEPIIIKAEVFAYSILNTETMIRSEFSQWEKCDLIIKIDLKNDLVTINNEAKTKIKIIAPNADKVDYIDQSCNEKYSKYSYDGISSEGQTSDIDVNLYEDGTIQVYFDIGNTVFAYQGKVIEF